MNRWHIAWLLAWALCATRLEARPFEPSARRRELKAEVRALRRELISAESSQRDVACARQIYQEVRWLLSYTAWFDRAARRLNDLRRALKSQESRAILDPADGSHGACHEEWFLKLDASVDRWMQLAREGREAPIPTRLLDRVNSPERLTEYLESLLVSEPKRTSVDNRKELNLASSALVRLIARRVPKSYRYHPRLLEALTEFLDRRWRNPATGFWGAWYREDGAIVKTDDLSITFHIASYRDGKIGDWPRTIRTLLAMKDRQYPQGWLESGRYSNHHNYDVVRLMRLGWPYLDEGLRKTAAAEIEKMLAWCLERTLEKDGRFVVEEGDDSLAEAYYFGVSFLEEAGFFEPARRFWTGRVLEGGQAWRRKIRGALEREMRKMQAPDSMMREAMRKL